MENEIEIIKLPQYTVYYKEGRIKDFSELVNFIVSSGEECRNLNPNLKCISPDYCYVSYLDKEFKKENMLIRYAQAVEEEGITNDTIKFETLQSVNAVCIYSKGPYSNLPEAYTKVMKYINDNNLEIIEPPRERYIDGMWNKQYENEWLTQIQVPIKK